MTNKPMLSVEREHRLKIHRKPFLDLESGAKTCEIRDCSDRDFQVGDSVLLMLVDEAGSPTPNELRRKITHIQTGYGLPDDLCVLSYGSAAHPQCEECKGWGYHENHHEGGGTECGECAGSGKATVAVVMVMPDRMEVEPFTTIDRGSKNYKAGYNAALAEVARLNRVNQ